MIRHKKITKKLYVYVVYVHGDVYVDSQNDVDNYVNDYVHNDPSMKCMMMAKI